MGRWKFNLQAVLDGLLCRRPERREGHGHLYRERIHMMLKRPLFSRGSFWGREERGRCMNVAVGRAEIQAQRQN